MDGWPQLVIEVWDKSDVGVKGLLGCASIWIPSAPGKHNLALSLWKPQPSGLAGLRESFVPSYYDINALRQLILTPSMRVGMTCITTGSVDVTLNVVASTYDAEGVELNG